MSLSLTQFTFLFCKENEDTAFAEIEMPLSSPIPLIGSKIQIKKDVFEVIDIVYQFSLDDSENMDIGIFVKDLKEQKTTAPSD